MADEITKTSNELATLSPEMAELFGENASLGSENLAGSLPLLKIHQTGRSKNELADGSEPHNGWFFYKPTQEEFETLDVHVLTISRGFRADGFEEKKDVFHQILAGVIVNDGAFKPFLMYFTGLKLENLWNFGKEVSPFTKMKPIGIPMFALKVKLSTSKKENKYGIAYIVNFEVMKGEDKKPLLVNDPEIFKLLKENVSTVQTTINNLIASKSTEDEATLTPVEENFEVPEKIEEAPEKKDGETEDIPF